MKHEGTALAWLILAALVCSCGKEGSVDHPGANRRAGANQRDRSAHTPGKPGPNGRAGANERDQSAHAPGKYDPKLLMPLSVGSSWTYKWTSPKVQGDEPVKFPKSFFESAKYYSYKGKTVIATRYHYRAQCHEETYTIVKRDGEHYFFEVTTDPAVPADQIRDGRYEDSVQNAWTWWKERGELGLTESIKRPWSIHRGYLAEGRSVKEGDYPADDRTAIQVEYANGTWNKMHVEYTFTDKRAFEYRIMGDTEVSVPAGKFSGCAKSIEKVLADDKENSAPLWEIHTFRCPGVGVVREYLKLPYGSIGYELQLVRYALASNKTDAGDGR